jgi:hypothetical protein
MPIAKRRRVKSDKFEPGQNKPEGEFFLNKLAQPPKLSLFDKVRMLKVCSGGLKDSQIWDATRRHNM